MTENKDLTNPENSIESEVQEQLVENLEMKESLPIYSVYVKTNANGLVTDIVSDYTINDTSDWIKIDKGSEEKYRRPQNEYLSKKLYNSYGRYNYKLVDGVIIERTEEEISSDIANNPPITSDNSISESALNALARGVNDARR